MLIMSRSMTKMMMRKPLATEECDCENVCLFFFVCFFIFSFRIVFYYFVYVYICLNERIMAVGCCYLICVL